MPLATFNAFFTPNEVFFLLGHIRCLEDFHLVFFMGVRMISLEVSRLLVLTNKRHRAFLSLS